jgi:hypothetical protein
MCFPIGYLLFHLHKVSLIINRKKSVKSVENYENQLLKSGDFLSGEKQQNQETPDEIRRLLMKSGGLATLLLCRIFT